MRAFLAVEPTGNAHDELVRLLKALQGQKEWLRPVKPEQLHLTLRFFAELPKAKNEAIRAALTEANLTGFTTSLSEIGCFPNWKRPRVVWAGCSEQGWQQLHRRIDETLASLGLGDDRRFHPHITLGRVKRPATLESLGAVQSIPVSRVEFPVDKLLLKKSILTSQGPTYSTVWSIPLAQDI